MCVAVSWSGCSPSCAANESALDVRNRFSVEERLVAKHDALSAPRGKGPRSGASATRSQTLADEVGTKVCGSTSTTPEENDFMGRSGPGQSIAERTGNMFFRQDSPQASLQCTVVKATAGASTGRAERVDLSEGFSTQELAHSF